MITRLLLSSAFGATAPAAPRTQRAVHTLNVVIHVAFGTLALVLGLIPLLVKKGGATHRRFGRYFLWCLTGVVATAVIGIFAFGFRAFLGVITLLAAYEGYSGYRVVKRRGLGPSAQDAFVSVAGLVVAIAFITYLQSVRVPWAPVVIYSILATLIAVVVYDLCRFAFPRTWFQRIWPYEHLVKMLGAYTAVVSAFSGTVFPEWQPYSQMAPSVLSTIAIVGFIVSLRRNRRTFASA